MTCQFLHKESRVATSRGASDEQVGDIELLRGNNSGLKRSMKKQLLGLYKDRSETITEEQVIKKLR
jgi:hypothetical protein